ncbi:MAG: hypothetical protein RMY28_029240 [Nostoc sp. ChiSLP01]|nr:substrate-binding domain-containing protein [Nostoc sp. CmiSLP01]MDZ8286999.1 substrate-binding domain-containing protein [Nostoc sp. ChiSLP01]
MSKIRLEDVANQRIESFAKRFGKAHLYLAYHAAFPLALTPDLLYRLWVKFQQDIDDKVLGIPWVAVADLLVSSLCNEVGYELYEMDLAVRNVLLSRLQEDKKFGQQRINELSNFLLDYVRPKLESKDPDIQDFALTQQWTALAYTQPSKLAYELALEFNKLDDSDTAGLVRMALLTEIFTKPLADFEPLLIYASAMGKFVRGDLEGAKVQLDEVVKGGEQIWVAGVSLPIPEKFKGNLPNPKNKVKASIPQLPVLLLSLAIIVGLVSASLRFFIENWAQVVKNSNNLISFFVKNQDKMVNPPEGTWFYGGSTSWAPIRRYVDPEIEKAYPQFELRYTDAINATPGSGTGIRMLLEGQLSFSQSSRPITDREFQRASSTTGIQPQTNSSGFRRISDRCSPQSSNSGANLNTNQRYLHW